MMRLIWKSTTGHLELNYKSCFVPAVSVHNTLPGMTGINKTLVFREAKPIAFFKRWKCPHMNSRLGYLSRSPCARLHRNHGAFGSIQDKRIEIRKRTMLTIGTRPHIPRRAPEAHVTHLGWQRFCLPHHRHLWTAGLETGRLLHWRRRSRLGNLARSFPRSLPLQEKAL